MTDHTTPPTPPASSTRPPRTTALWGLAMLVVGAIGLGIGHQWGLYDRSQLAVAAASDPSPSTSPSSTNADPSPSSSGGATEVAPACETAGKYVKSVVRRSDLAAEHPKSTKDVTACR